MKRTFTFISLLFSIVFIFAQSPEKLKYQTVVRNSSGALVKNSPVNFKISILKTSETGTVIYTETHSTSTNEHGLVTLNIGGGSTSDVFGSIDWGADVHYVKIEADIAGGTSYQHMGTSQLLSVPYSLYSKDAALLNGESDAYYKNATNIDAGTLNTSRFSAYSDLIDEGRLDNNSANDILTRTQADERYIPEKSAFSAYLNSNIAITSKNWTDDIVFPTENVDDGSDYNNTTGIYTAPVNGIYNFAASAGFLYLSDGTRIVVGIYINTKNTIYLNSSYANTVSNYQSFQGSHTLKLDAGDKVSIRIYSSDDSYTILGNRLYTNFSGFLVYPL